MDWDAAWIWDDGEASPRNRWQCFRTTFALGDRAWDEAVISLTADNRYLLWVNGVWVGRGPARSWSDAPMFDRYDVAHFLQRDATNVIAVLVQHLGVSTFSSIRNRAGLLAQLDLMLDGWVVQRVATDATWRTARHGGFDPWSSRMSVQLGFSEDFDARRWDEEWIEAAFDDSAWPEASIVAAVGEEPWPRLQPSDCPPLSEQVIAPSRVASMHRVSPIAFATTIELRDLFVPERSHLAGGTEYAGCIATVIDAKPAGRFMIGLQDCGAVPVRACSVNGTRCPIESFSGVAPQRFLTVDLPAGENWLVVELTGRDDGLGLEIGVDADVPFRLVSPLPGEDETPFVAIGPFAVDAEPGANAARLSGRVTVRDPEVFVVASMVDSPETLALFTEAVRPVPAAFVAPDDPFARFAWARERESLPVTEPVQRIAIPGGEPGVLPALESGDTEVVVDFGKEWSGFLTFEIGASEGTVIDLYGYEYQDGVTGRRQETFGLQNTLRFTCRGGRQRHTSPIRRGFRYLAIALRNGSGPVTFHALGVIQSNFPVAERGQFHCSDPLLEQIWEISRHTTRLCMEDTFVDCPAYEQVFWVGDSRNESLVATYAFGAEALTRRCLRLVPESGAQTSLYNSQVPSGWQIVIPNWTFFWVIACLEYYERTDDRAFVTEIWPHVRQTLEHYLGYRNADDLLDIDAWNLLDWAPTDQPTSGVVVHQNCFLIKALRAAITLGSLAGDATAKHFETAAGELRAAIERHCWSETRSAYIDAIHRDGRRSDALSAQTQVVAYLCDIPSPERRAQIEPYLTDAPADFVQIGSPFMSFFHYEALARAGRHDAILSDMRTNYGAMIERGATTCWEMYATTDINRANPDFLSRSHCHAWSAGPLYFLGAYSLGVRAQAPGWRTILVQPAPGDLAWARGSVPHPSGGTIDVAWQRHGGDRELTLFVTAPAGITVEARLPEGYTGSVDLRQP